MTHFPDYKTATNAAYKLIAERDWFSIETNVFSIAEQLNNCRVYTYGLANFWFDIPLEVLLANSEYGFSIVKKGKRIIYYNEKMPLSCIRFTLAHEIGHAVLGHQDEDDPSAEKEANCFARNLLCPLPTANALGVGTAEDYVSAFGIGIQMAQATVGRRDSDTYYIDASYFQIIDQKLYAYNLGYESLAEFERYMLA